MNRPRNLEITIRDLAVGAIVAGGGWALGHTLVTFLIQWFVLTFFVRTL